MTAAAGEDEAPGSDVLDDRVPLGEVDPQAATTSDSAAMTEELERLTVGAVTLRAPLPHHNQVGHSPLVNRA